MSVSGEESVVNALPCVTIMSFGALREAFMNTMLLGGLMLHHIKMRY